MLADWLGTAKPVEPYSELASIYDYVMRHVNYGRWAAYLCKLFKKAEGEVSQILDIACGTGSLLAKLANIGFRVTGFDMSPAMVRMAKAKVLNCDQPVPLWCGSMMDFGVQSKFDSIICTYDSINYCLKQEAYEATLLHSAQAVRPGGLFIFDVCTQKNSRMHFKNYYENDGNGEYDYIRQSFYSPGHNIQTNEFIITRNSGAQTSFKERHQQRIYRISDLLQSIPADLFDVIGVYDGFSLRAGSEKSERVHFVLKRL